MTLYEQWSLIQYIVNKDYQGNIIEPDMFKQLVKVANMDMFKIKMGLPEDYQIGTPLSRQYVDLNERMTDETLFLKKRDSSTAVSSGKFAYPNDYFQAVSIRYNYQRNIDGVATVIPRPVQRLTEDKYSARAGNWTKKPSTLNPVCVLRSDGIYVYPDTITEVDFSYIRYPNDPVFDYVLNTGYITEGGSPTEYEWPKILHNDLTRIILGYIGINLRSEQIQGYAEMHKKEGV
jgi:hypothetical protein